MSVPKLKPFLGWPFHLAELVNQVVRRVNRPWEFIFDTNSLNPIVKIDETEDKVTVTLPRGGSGAGATASRLPLEPVPTTDGDSPALYVTDGTFGGNALAPEVSATPEIDGDPISLAGDDRPKLTLSGDEQCVYLIVTVDSDKLVSAAPVVAVSNDPEPPDNSDSVVNVKLGSLSFIGGAVAVTRNLSGSQSYAWCGGHKYALI